jgi:acyl carrier protein
MESEKIRAAIIDVTSQIQSQSQRDMPAVCGQTHLIGDVPGFDSLNAVELVILLSDALGDELHGRNIPDRVVLGAGKNARPTVDEIVKSIEQYLATPMKSKKPKRGGAVPAVSRPDANPKEDCDAETEN